MICAYDLLISFHRGRHDDEAIKNKALDIDLERNPKHVCAREIQHVTALVLLLSCACARVGVKYVPVLVVLLGSWHCKLRCDEQACGAG